MSRLFGAEEACHADEFAQAIWFYNLSASSRLRWLFGTKRQFHYYVVKLIRFEQVHVIFTKV